MRKLAIHIRARSVAEISNGGFVPPGTPRLDHKSFHGSMHHMHAGANPAALMAVRSRLVGILNYVTNKVTNQNYPLLGHI